jgi:hypothetical protein
VSWLHGQRARNFGESRGTIPTSRGREERGGLLWQVSPHRPTAEELRDAKTWMLP